MSTKKDNLLTEAKALVENNKFGEIKDRTKKAITQKLLENTLFEVNGIDENGNSLQEAAPANNSGTSNIAKYDPILMPLLRRMVPNLLAFDICGVQPMTGPTGLIFSMRAKYGAAGDADLTDNAEALFNEAVTSFSGKGTHAQTDPFHTSGSPAVNDYTTGTAYTTLEGEQLGDGTNPAIAQMGFTIDKTPVTAGTRALKAEYTHELETDLKKIHNLDAKSELANILSTELIAEINREVVRDIYTVATVGCQNTATVGTFDIDVDADGRFLGEKIKGLIFQIEKEANEIAKTTRRGKGNIVICSSNIASGLNMAGVLAYNPELAQSMNVDDTGNTFAGILNGRFKVYIDPYLSSGTSEFIVVGYKGANQYDAGYFYCPYVPLQMVQTVGQSDFQPKMAFRTRYGKVTNPYANATGTAGAITANVNRYYRKFKVTNL